MWFSLILTHQSCFLRGCKPKQLFPPHNAVCLSFTAINKRTPSHNTRIAQNNSLFLEYSFPLTKGGLYYSFMKFLTNYQTKKIMKSRLASWKKKNGSINHRSPIQDPWNCRYDMKINNISISIWRPKQSSDTSGLYSSIK